MGNLLTYTSEKEVIIKNVWLRLGKLFIQLAVLAYIVWVIVRADGYQKQSIGFGSTQLKVKGSSYSNQSGELVVWDSTNVVYPENELDSLFLVTNYIKTPNQTRTTCLGNDPKTESCTNDSNCGVNRETTNGITTGKCVNGTCELFAWCPLEVDSPPSPDTTLRFIGNFSVYLKTFAQWKSWGYRRDNVNGQLTPGYNSFSIADFVAELTEVRDTLLKRWPQLAERLREVSPRLQVLSGLLVRFADSQLDPTEGFSQGYNYRFTNRYRVGEIGIPHEETRDLYKVYGLRFAFLTFAKARKFDVVTLVLSIGTGIGTMFMANYIADFILIWFLPRSAYYRNRKYMNVDEQKKEERRQQWSRYLTPEQLNKAYF